MMSAWLDNQLADETRPRLAKKGIESLDYEAYYPFQIFLDTMREIVQENRNVTMQLVAIGKAVVEHMQIDDFDTMEDFETLLTAPDGLYHGALRNAPTYENYVLEQHDGEFYFLNNTPVSNDMVFGFLWELLNHVRIDGEYYTPIPHEHYPSNERGSIFLLELRDA
ncbi:MAG: hypothetical protein AAF787_11780 [Chloroflexota bacterium]